MLKGDVFLVEFVVLCAKLVVATPSEGFLL